MKNYKKEKNMEYKEMRKRIYDALYDLLDREFECTKDNEFDFEFFEAITDDIIRITKEYYNG